MTSTTVKPVPHNQAYKVTNFLPLTPNTPKDPVRYTCATSPYEKADDTSLEGLWMPFCQLKENKLIPIMCANGVQLRGECIRQGCAAIDLSEYPVQKIEDAIKSKKLEDVSFMYVGKDTNRFPNSAVFTEVMNNLPDQNFAYFYNFPAIIFKNPNPASSPPQNPASGTDANTKVPEPVVTQRYIAMIIPATKRKDLFRRTATLLAAIYDKCSGNGMLNTLQDIVKVSCTYAGRALPLFPFCVSEFTSTPAAFEEKFKSIRPARNPIVKPEDKVANGEAVLDKVIKRAEITKNNVQKPLSVPKPKPRKSMVRLGDEIFGEDEVQEALTAENIDSSDDSDYDDEEEEESDSSTVSELIASSGEEPEPEEVVAKPIKTKKAPVVSRQSDNFESFKDNVHLTTNLNLGHRFKKMDVDSVHEVIEAAQSNGTSTAAMSETDIIEQAVNRLDEESRAMYRAFEKRVNNCVVTGKAKTKMFTAAEVDANTFKNQEFHKACAYMTGFFYNHPVHMQLIAELAKIVRENNDVARLQEELSQKDIDTAEAKIAELQAQITALENKAKRKIGATDSEHEPANKKHASKPGGESGFRLKPTPSPQIDAFDLNSFL